MTAFRAADIQSMLDRFGVDVTFNAVTVKGLLDTSDEDVLRGEAAGSTARTVAATVKTGALAGLTPGAAITIDGVARKIHSVQLLEDRGSFTRIVAVLQT